MHFFQRLMCVYSILHLYCTHYILWTPTFRCDNGMSPLAWFPLPASTPLPHSCASPRCAFWLRHSAKQSHPQKALVHGPQFSPQRVDPAPISTFQLDRTEGEAGCDANDLCVKPLLSLSDCVHAGDFTQLHISFLLIYLYSFLSFYFSFFEWEIISDDSLSFHPQRQSRDGRKAGE